MVVAIEQSRWSPYRWSRWLCKTTVGGNIRKYRFGPLVVRALGDGREPLVISVEELLLLLVVASVRELVLVLLVCVPIVCVTESIVLHSADPG